MSKNTKYIKADSVEVPIAFPEENDVSPEVQGLIEKLEGGNPLSDDELKVLVSSVRVSPSLDDKIDNKNCNIC